MVNSEGQSTRLRGVNLADPEHIVSKRSSDLISVLHSVRTQLPAANAIRLPILPGDAHSGYFRNPDLYIEKYIDPVVDAGKSLKFYIILELHYIKDYKSVEKNVHNFWKTIAQRYSSEDHVIFDLINEPIAPNDWTFYSKEFVVPLVQLVRKYSENLIIVSGTNWALNLNGVLEGPIEATNIVYAAHIYPENYTIENLKVYEKILQQYPLFITEWGFDNQSEFPVRGTTSSFGKPIVDWLDKYQLSWTAWVFDPVWMLTVVDKDWKLSKAESTMGALLSETL